MDNKYNYGYIGVINETPIKWEYFPDLQTTLPYNCSRVYGLSKLGSDEIFLYCNDEGYTSYNDADMLSFILNTEEDYCKEVKFKQFTSINNIYDGNEECFNKMIELIKKYNTVEHTRLIDVMLTFGESESNLDAYNYGDIVNGKAGNIGEVVYESSSYILTVSETAITLFVRI